MANSGQLITIRAPDGADLPVRLEIDARASRISLRVDRAARQIVLKLAHERDTRRALAFAHARSEWVAFQLARMPSAIPFQPGALVPLRGVLHTLVGGPGRGAPYVMGQETPQLIVPASDAAALAIRTRKFLVELARQDLSAAVRRHAEQLNVKPTRISIKDTRSRWGSCTSSGALSFSWRVILAPPPILDYLAAHEVAHLREMNHSPAFWALVKQTYGDHKRARAWLKREGERLHAYGA